MKYYLISDNIDTRMGMRLAGVEGCVVHTAEETERELKKAVGDESIGILLITEKLSELCPELVYDIKLHAKRPLIVVIPDRHGSGRGVDSITRYVNEAIGVKV